MRGAGALLAVGLLALVRPAGGAELPLEPVAVLAEGLAAPTAVEVSADRIAVLDPYRDRLVLFTAEGRLEARLDLAGRAQGLALRPDGTYALGDRETGGVIFVDAGTGAVRRGPAPRDEVDLLDLRVVAGELWALDARNAEILALDEDGAVRGRLPLRDEAGERLVYPSSFTVHGEEIFVLDQPASRIHVYDGDGAHLRGFCSFGAGEGEVTRGGCLRADARGLIFLADRFQGRVAVFDVAGEFHGHLDPAASGDEPLAVPVGIGTDDGGLLYVASAEAGRVGLFAVGAPAAVPAALAVEPSGSEVPAEDPVFVLEALFSSIPPVPVGMDVRLWKDAAPEPPVAEIEALPAEPQPGASEGAVIYRAVWRPEIALEPGTAYSWSARVRVGPRAGLWSEPWGFATASAPRVFRLEQNRPNPFRTATTIAFSVPEAADARLAVYDLQGREIWSRELPGLGPGSHEEVWAGRDARGRPAPPGIYFCRMTAGGRTETRKMVLTGGRP